jgi:hypothetical protein
VSVCVHISMKAACFGDEKLSFIRSFHSSTLFWRRALPKAEHFYIPPCDMMFEPNWTSTGCGPPFMWCAEWKAGVGIMRDENDLPLDVWTSFFSYARKFEVFTNTIL